MRRYRFSSMMQLLVPLFAVIVLFADAAVVRAQGPPAEQVPAPTTSDEKQAAGMTAEFQKIMAALSASDQKLGQLIAAIDTARGDDDKIDAITAVLKEMAAQRTATREEAVALARRMMGHMMEHMSGGVQGMSCPMMKELAKPGEPDHSQHRSGQQ